MNRLFLNVFLSSLLVAIFQPVSANLKFGKANAMLPLARAMCHIDAGNMTRKDAHELAEIELQRIGYRNSRKLLSDRKVRQYARFISNQYKKNGVNCYSTRDINRENKRMKNYIDTKMMLLTEF
tara:strand:+ start:177 stop:548 length:372 start_codon:yes stop_codon:yes gene_type:complete